jgi:hypothetical protein
MTDSELGSNEVVIPLSARIYRPLVQAGRAFRIGLFLLLLGTAVLISAPFLPLPWTTIALVMGGLLNIVVCVLFYLRGVRVLDAYKQEVAENRTTLDALQQSGLTLTQQVLLWQKLFNRYGRQVAALTQLVRQLPMFGKMADSETVRWLDSTSALMADQNGELQAALLELDEALRLADGARLQTAVGKIQRLQNQWETPMPPSAVGKT